MLRNSENISLTTARGFLAQRVRMTAQPSGAAFDRKLAVWWWRLRKSKALWHHDSPHTATLFISWSCGWGWNLKDLLGCQTDILHGPHLIPSHVALNIWWHTKTQSWEENVLPRAEKLPASPQRCRCSSKSSRVSHVCRFIRKKEDSAITRIRW